MNCFKHVNSLLQMIKPLRCSGGAPVGEGGVLQVAAQVDPRSHCTLLGAQAPLREVRLQHLIVSCTHRTPRSAAPTCFNQSLHAPTPQCAHLCLDLQAYLHVLSESLPAQMCCPPLIDMTCRMKHRLLVWIQGKLIRPIYTESTSRVHTRLSHKGVAVGHQVERHAGVIIVGGGYVAVL